MKKIVLCMVLVTSAYSISIAQSLINGELKNLLNQSLQYFPKVKEVQQSVQLAEDKLMLTELNKYPDITMDASYAYVQPKIEVAFGEKTFQFAPVHNVSGALNGSYTLFDFGRLASNIQKAKLELQTSKHVAEQLKHSLFFQISQLYYQIIYAKKAIEIQNQVVQLLAENKNIIETQLKNGNAIQLDLLTIQSKIDNELNRKIDLETNLKKLLNLLNYATGVSTINESQLSISLKNYTSDEAMQMALIHNPSIAIAKDKVNVTKAEVAITKLNERPYVGMKASVGSRNGYLPQINDPRFNYNAGIGFSVPLFNGGKIKQQIKIQERSLALSETNVQSQIHDFEKDIQAALIDIQSNQARIKNAATQIEQAALAQKLSVSKLKNGTATPIEITSTNADYQRALLNQLQYQYQLCNAQLELIKLMGVELID
ncbi:MAG: TolC family protein [Chitinophagia bacterium]|nr:TolC family protein [Chitinophagia bacterium]NCA30240.1 TolC family protein [Chitinophagia bacterium]NDD15744.1 TolC family protein [Chitinophagia bacterium]